MPQSQGREKTALLGGVLSAGRTIATRLPSAMRMPGVGKRALIGAGVGAVGGGLTAPDGKGGRRMLMGAGLGAMGGALSSAGFRGAMAGKAFVPSPAGTAMARGAKASVDVPGSAFTIQKRADLSYDNTLTHAGNAAIGAGWAGAAGSVAAKMWRGGSLSRAGAVGVGGLGALAGVGAIASTAAAVRASDRGDLIPTGSDNKVVAGINGGVTSAAHGMLAGHMIGTGKRVPGALMATGAGMRFLATGMQVGRSAKRPPSAVKDDGENATPQPREGGK